ncbi:MAG: hypothetical protein ACI91Z_001310, partial [Yoonia sp.]
AQEWERYACILRSSKGKTVAPIHLVTRMKSSKQTLFFRPSRNMPCRRVDFREELTLAACTYTCHPYNADNLQITG